MAVHAIVCQLMPAALALRAGNAGGMAYAYLILDCWTMCLPVACRQPSMRADEACLAATGRNVGSALAKAIAEVPAVVQARRVEMRVRKGTSCGANRHSVGCGTTSNSLACAGTAEAVAGCVQAHSFICM
jgi:hypothetical protein